jgi:hypothetical protein
MRTILTALLAGVYLVVVLGSGCTVGTVECGACIDSLPATFVLSCSRSDLASVVATRGSGPCATIDASAFWASGGNTPSDVNVFSTEAGVCHVVLTFASGFRYSADVTFASGPGGCRGCPPAIKPMPPATFQVDNPASTCLGGPDAGDDEGGR